MATFKGSILKGSEGVYKDKFIFLPKTSSFIIEVLNEGADTFVYIPDALQATVGGNAKVKGELLYEVEMENTISFTSRNGFPLLGDIFIFEGAPFIVISDNETDAHPAIFVSNVVSNSPYGSFFSYICSQTFEEIFTEI